MIHEKSCGIVVYCEKNADSPEGKIRKFLILHYPSGHFDFPKGHVEKDEEERETAKRELQEETGIEDCELHPSFRENMHYTYERGEETYQKEVIFFLGKTDTTEIKISHEHQGFRWLTYEESLKILTFENARRILRKANSYILIPKS